MFNNTYKIDRREKRLFAIGYAFRFLILQIELNTRIPLTLNEKFKLLLFSTRIVFIWFQGFILFSNLTDSTFNHKYRNFSIKDNFKWEKRKIKYFYKGVKILERE